MSDNKKEPVLTVSVKNIRELLFKGEARAITSNNVRGEFDILPYHANFISLVKDGVTLHLPNKEIMQIPFKSAVLKVHENLVHILVDIGME